MIISLTVKGKEKIYTTKFIKARMLRNAMQIASTVDFGNVGPEGLDTLIGFLCDVYDNQFTIDDVYDGIESDKLMSTLIDAIGTVIRGTASKLEQSPNEEAGK